MNRIDDLIAEHCPAGVEHKAFGELGTITRGKRFVKSDMVETGTPCIHYGELYTKYGTWATESHSYLEPELASRLRLASPGDVIFVTAGETIEDIGKAVAWLGEEDVVIHDALYAFRSSLDPKYVAYFSQTHNFHNQIRRHISSAKISSISTKNLGKVRIPIPPTEIQREIVKMLDTFTELEAELELELEARQRQYQYYRDALLHFDEHTADASKQASIRWTTLGEIATYARLRIPSSGLDDDSYVGVDNLLSDMQGKVSSTYTPSSGTSIGYEVGDILIGNIRPYLKKIWLADSSGGTNQDVLVIRIKEEERIGVTPQFLYYSLASDDFFAYDMQNAKGAKMPRGDKAAIMRFPITIPTLKEQARIVAILDKFDELVNGLSNGLPAEINARRRQYEYYRDQLLTFREAA